jgi:molybdate transport system substrate-binding protein
MTRGNDGAGRGRLRSRTWWVAVWALAGLTQGAMAAEIQVLSAGAVEPGIHAAAHAYSAQSGHKVTVRFATAPAMRKRVAGGEVADVVIAPPPVLDDFLKAGKIEDATRIALGRVGVGIAVREGAPVPDISSPEALRASVLGAESLVFNQASTGLYMDRLFEKMGLTAEVKAKSARYPDGNAVMEHLLKGKGREFGFGAATEIVLFRDKGLRLVGPLPASMQNYTAYAAVPMTAAPSTELARDFVRFLASPAGKKLFVANGID